MNTGLILASAGADFWQWLAIVGLPVIAFIANLIITIRADRRARRAEIAIEQSQAKKIRLEAKLLIHGQSPSDKGIASHAVIEAGVVNLGAPVFLDRVYVETYDEAQQRVVIELETVTALRSKAAGGVRGVRFAPQIERGDSWVVRSDLYLIDTEFWHQVLNMQRVIALTKCGIREELEVADLVTPEVRGLKARPSSDSRARQSRFISRRDRDL